MTMMTHIPPRAKKVLRPILLAALVLVSAPAFVLFEQSTSGIRPIIAKGVVVEQAASERTTIIYKS